MLGKGGREQAGPGDGRYSSAVFRPEPPVIRSAEDDLVVVVVVDVAVVGNLVVAEVVIKMEEIDKTVETIEVDCAGVVLTVVVLG